MILVYTPDDWFWIVGNDDGRAWSSAAGGYVSQWDAERTTRIASEAELNEVLRPYGLVLPDPGASDYSAAIQDHIDDVAAARGYANGIALSGYKDSTYAPWSAEAATFIAWRDAVWLYAYGEMAKVQNGTRAKPSVAEIIAELPSITW